MGSCYEIEVINRNAAQWLLSVQYRNDKHFPIRFYNSSDDLLTPLAEITGYLISSLLMRQSSLFKSPSNLIRRIGHNIGI